MEKHRTWNDVHNFCENSTLHGVPQIVAYKRHFLERYQIGHTNYTALNVFFIILEYFGS